MFIREYQSSDCNELAELFYFIGNSDFEIAKKEQKFIEHTLDKFLSRHNDKTIQIRGF